MNKTAFDHIDKLDAEYFNALRDKLVPACGKAEFVAGEIIRAMDRLIYRFWNDGDMVGNGYGNETCNGSYRYMYRMLGENCPDLYVVNDNEEKYTDALAKLADEVKNHLESNPELFVRENLDDSRSDYDLAEDRNWMDDEEEDDDYYRCGW